MALHPDFPDSPHAVLDPEVRWFPTAETLRETRPEKLMPPLVAKLRREVKAFRDSGYAGARPTSRSLLRWWFQEPHLLERAAGRREEFRYFFAQREAVETIVYLYDAAGVRDKYDLMRFDGSGAVSAGMFDETWRRFVVKMATGSGKTKVLSLVLAWSYFHKLYEPDSALARNFLVIAPNVIVLDRLYKDFRGLRIFFADPVLPDDGFDGRNWRDDFQLRLHVQDQVRVTAPTGNVFLTNIHRVYAGNDTPPSPDDDNSMDYFLGPRPTGATTDSKVDLGAIVRDVDELAVLNDEAHHIHDDKLAWFKSIQDIHHRLLQKGGALSVQVDVTATPKHDNGAVFVQTVADYPLVEAISQNVVKHPVLPDGPSRAKLVERPSAKYTEQYADYLALGVVEWRKAAAMHAELGEKEQVSVVGTDAFMEFVESIQAEGVTLERAAMGEGAAPLTPLVIEVDTDNDQKDLAALDIEIPILTPRTYREYAPLAGLNVADMAHDPLPYRQFDVEEHRTIVFRDATTGEAAHTTTLDAAGVADYRSAIGYFAHTLRKELRLVSGYDVLFGALKSFVRTELFGQVVDLEDPNTLRNLSEPAATKRLIETFKKAINALTVRDRGGAEIRDTITVSHTRPFVAKDQPYLLPHKSVFNRIIGDSPFELEFAQSLDRWEDVATYAKNYFAVSFKLDYVNAAGDVAHYYPDFLVRATDGAVFIVETKGREELDLPSKMARLRQWCADVNRAQSAVRYDFGYVDQPAFEHYRPTSLRALVKSFTDYKEGK